MFIVNVIGLFLSTHFLLQSTLQHGRGPHDAVVPLVQVVVLGRAEVCQDEDRL